MRELTGWLGVLACAALGCGGESHANGYSNNGGTEASGTEANGGSSGGAGSSSGGHAGGANSGGGVSAAGITNGGAETNGGSTVTSAGGNAGTPGSAGAAGSSGSAGAAGLGGSPDETYPHAKRSAGCGQDAPQATGQFVQYTIQTSGTKDANCADKLLDGTPNCGAWSYARDYYVWLPPNYDNQRAYPLVLQAPGCGGNGLAVVPLPSSGNPGIDGSVIRVGLTPPPKEVGHATNPNQGCFDDREGDDSVEWPFYEALIDKLKSQLCYDENRVFATGNSSGAWLANELGCKYAGNEKGYAIRGVAASRGGLPTQPAFTPTCSNKPLSGIWIDLVNDNTDPFASGDKIALSRAMQVSGCPTGFDEAQLQNFPIGGGLSDDTCKQIIGCSSADPLVVCQLPGQSHSGLDQYASPGFTRYIKTFELP